MDNYGRVTIGIFIIIMLLLCLGILFVGACAPAPENNTNSKLSNPVQRETTGGEYTVYDYDVFKLTDLKNNIVCYGTLKGESNIQCFDLNSK